MRFNFLALETKTKTKKPDNNYECKLNKEERKAKVSLFRPPYFLLVIHGADMTIKPKRGGKKKPKLSYVGYPGKVTKILEECSYGFEL